MIVIRTEQIKESDKLIELCHYSKNLWNEANYIIRQEFFKNRKWLRYNELDKKLKSSENYKSLNAQSSQQTLKLVDDTWKAIFKGMKFAKGIEGVVLHPIRVNNLETRSYNL